MWAGPHPISWRPAQNKKPTLWPRQFLPLARWVGDVSPLLSLDSHWNIRSSWVLNLLALGAGAYTTNLPTLRPLESGWSHPTDPLLARWLQTWGLLGLHNHVNQLLISLCCTREPGLTLLNLNEPGSPRGANSRKKHYSLLTWEGSGKRPMSLTVLYQSKKGRLQVTEADATCYSVYWKGKALPSTVFHPLVKPLQSFLVLQLWVKTQLPILAPAHINRQANFPRLSSFFWDSWIVAIKQT